MKSSRSIASILKDNIFTLFNVILTIVALVVLTTGEIQQCLFMFIIVINSAIGIATEFKAKRTLDKLKLLIDQKYHTIRKDSQGIEEVLEITASEIKKGDIIKLTVGSQVPVDGKVLQGNAELNESILTGESINVNKKIGDKLMSGTLVVVGECEIEALSSHSDSYATKLTAAAKQFKIASSDLRDGINKILKYVSFGIIPVSLLMIWTQMRQVGGIEVAFSNGEWRAAILSTAASVVGMVPEGLVLLTSLNFALSAIRLAKINVLVTELNSVETLARVNELILDKTGTITDGTIEVLEIQNSTPELLSILYQLTLLPGGTATSDSIKNYLQSRELKNIKVIDSHSFDSAKKYSSITIEDQNKEPIEYKMGAPEYIAPQVDVSKWTKQGLRTLVMKSNKTSDPILIILCREKIRAEAKDIIAYFKKSGVNVQVVSGDNPTTVNSIAKEVGIETVVGRAKPETKLEIVRKLQSEGKVVAMTGDGVNDVLALKEADLGIAVGNAAPAAKAVANIVLIDSDFSKLPKVVNQGRHVMANMERVASLFLVKTFYSITLSLATILFQIKYPFMPIHLTAVSALCIGIPGFFIGLQPSNDPYRKGFLKRVLKFSLPYGILVAACVLIISKVFQQYQPTAAVIILFVLSFIVIAIKARPLLSYKNNTLLPTWRLIMLIILILITIAGFLIPWTATFFRLY
ncbi:MAG: HAD-IC family P-type ATPase [Candidatus Ancillula sp.]|jgi:cation-transporting ATPase E|nr:HAD-IC family P-type ATPase [Candidatus Ancillula sp.]